MISNKAYENFINFASSICVPSQTSKLLCNLKLEIEKFPSIKELIQIYEANFLVKENGNKSNSKKKWRHDESILFVFILVAYCEMQKKETDDLSDEDWRFIASLFMGLTPENCQFKWKSMQKSILQKDVWSQEEDRILLHIIQKKKKIKDSYKWTEIAKDLNTTLNNNVIRLGKHCRERWFNHIDPNRKTGEWKINEDLYILESILEAGKKWSQISKNLQGRTENAVKNRFITMVRQYLKINIPKRSRDKSFNPLNVNDSVVRQIIASLSKHTVKKYEDNPVKHRKISNDIIIPAKNDLSEKKDLQIKQEINEELEKSILPKIPDQNPKNGRMMKRDFSMETLMDSFRLSKSIPRIGSFESTTDTNNNFKVNDFKKYNAAPSQMFDIKTPPVDNNRKIYNFENYNYFENPDFSSFMNDERFYEQNGFVEFLKLISNGQLNCFNSQVFGYDRNQLKSGEGEELIQTNGGNMNLGSPKKNFVIHKNESCSNFLNLE